MLGVRIFDFLFTAEGAEGAEEEKREKYGAKY
jgi:hypothetical protein